jgi:hypothetical protein
MDRMGRDIMRKDKIRKRHDWLEIVKVVNFYKMRQDRTGQNLTRKNGWVV